MTDTIILNGEESFRPLAGITVFRTRNDPRSVPARTGSFRPLAGITVFRTEAYHYRLRVDYKVSVPWRGLRSFGLDASTIPRHRLGVVSVPWRGLRSFGQRRHWKSKWRPTGFPSPGGDYGLSDRFRPKGPPGTRPSFRPLAGITVFRTTHVRKRLGYQRVVFPSPGGDYGLSDFV